MPAPEEGQYESMVLADQPVTYYRLGDDFGVALNQANPALHEGTYLEVDIVEEVKKWIDGREYNIYIYT